MPYGFVSEAPSAWGIDSGPGRNHSLNDTLIVASIDPVSHKVAMVSFPRDIANFPLYNGVKSMEIGVAKASWVREASVNPGRCTSVGKFVSVPCCYSGTWA